MDVLIVLLIVLLGALIAGGLVYIAREVKDVSGPSSLPGGGMDALRGELESRQQSEVERMRSDIRGVLSEVDAELNRLRVVVREAQEEQASWTGQLREQIAAIEAPAPSPPPRAYAASTTPAQALPVVAELDQRLAKLEMCFSSVANPLLLPGEPFAVPDQLPAEAMRWEAWKEVGDAAFAFAESFAAGRIHLHDSLSRELAQFIGAVRTQLTTEIYPSLVRGSSQSVDGGALRDVVERFGAEIAATRGRLRAVYVELIG